MKLLKDSIKRCAIFLFYDKDGYVDEYILYMLKDLKENVDDLLVVSNGAICQESREKLEEITDDILIRANRGFDVGGYREGLFYYGFEKLQKYDEVIMLNYTFYGPLYPFSEMFDSMAEKDLDFWGITNHFQVTPDPYGQNRYGYLPEHLQSHFLVVRRSLLSSDAYKEFMINTKNPASYVDSVCDYESIFQKHFLDMGFKGEAYCDASEYEDYVYNPIMFRMKEMIAKQRCPIVKRRSFFTDYHDFMLNSCGESTSEAYEYIRTNLDYDTKLIWDNLLRLENMTEISRAMHLNYMLPEKEKLQRYCPYKKIAIYVFVHSTKHIDDYLNYLYAIPSEVATYFLCKGSDFDVQSLQKSIGERDNFIILPDDQEDWFAELQKLIERSRQTYSYIAICDIKDYEMNAPYSNRVSWQYSDWKNILPTEAYITNVIATFEQNERLGMLVPPMPEFGDLYGRLQNGWMGRYEQVRQLLVDNQIQVNIKEQDEPLAPFGGSFWLRTEALNYIPERSWINMQDEELVLLTMPFLVQKGNFYTGIIYNMEYASIAVTNQDYMMRETNKAVFEKFGPTYHKIEIERIKGATRFSQLPPEVRRKFVLKRKLKRMERVPVLNRVYVIAKRVYIKIRR